MTIEDLRKIDEELREHYSPHPLPPGGHVDIAVTIDGTLATPASIINMAWEDDTLVPNPEPEILEGDS